MESVAGGKGRDEKPGTGPGYFKRGALIRQLV